ncbi:hypothetical protein [Stenotrophomonas sp. ATCM1_4]|uniref:hypothetical protein n=1 Tax=Stenotrophomonas sp. ATCM1_4 TaxID=2259330 RepID=UPI001404C581|nr:hypothetical protein [Stenotrophomonas sp. ATCM1_4]
MNDQQRARELASRLDTTASAYGMLGEKELPTLLREAAAALRAAPEVPAARVTEPLRADESRQEQADSAIYNRGWNDCRAALLNQHRVAIVADSPQVVPSPALGAHEVHPEAVDVGLDLGEAGERLVAADALEHASGVRQNCDGSATAPAAWTAVPVELTDEQLRNANRQTGLGRAELRALWATLLAARPQGVKDAS